MITVDQLRDLAVELVASRNWPSDAELVALAMVELRAWCRHARIHIEDDVPAPAADAVERALAEWERGVALLNGYASDRVRAALLVLNTAASDLRAALAAARAGQAEPTQAQRDHEAWAIRNIGVPPAERLAAQRGGEAVDREALAQTEATNYARGRAESLGQDAALVGALARGFHDGFLAARGDAAPTVSTQDVNRAYWATHEGITMEDLTIILAALGIEVRP